MFTQPWLESQETYPFNFIKFVTRFKKLMEYPFLSCR